MASLSLISLLLLWIFAAGQSAPVDEASEIDKKSQLSERVSATDAMDGTYGVIIDAGSTGSRLFVYRWNGFMDLEPVIDKEENRPVSKKISPGLSTFDEKPKDAPIYLKPLLDYATQFIPEESRSNTPVFIFATAGMRLLSKENQDAILFQLRKELPKLTELLIRDENIQVIAGEWEGLYCWIAVNYLLNRFPLPNATGAATTESSSSKLIRSNREVGLSEKKPRTVAIIDMGGASVQIAFEVPPQVPDAQNAKPLEETTASTGIGTEELVHSVNLGGRRYSLYVTTFLGYGVNEASKKYEQLIRERFGEMLAAAENSSSIKVPSVEDKCLPTKFYRVSSAEDDAQFVRRGTGDWDGCVHDLGTVLFPAKASTERQDQEVTELRRQTAGSDAEKRCRALARDGRRHFFNGISAPGIPSLSEMEIYGFSEYWFSAEDVLDLGGPYKHDEFEAKAREFCSQRWAKIKQKGREKEYPNADNERLQTQCFKSAWIHAVLHDGFCINEIKNHFQSALTIDDQEVQWTLGAVIYQMRDFPIQRVRSSSGVRGRTSSRTGSSSSSHALIYTLFIIAFIGAAYFFYRARQQQKWSSGSEENCWRTMLGTAATWGLINSKRVKSPVMFGGMAGNSKYNLLRSGPSAESLLEANLR